MTKLDMHTHTKYSDASSTLEDVLAKAAREGLEYIAITDHDSCINLKDKEILEKIYNVKIIRGIEITSGYKRAHILGYGLKKEKLDKVEKEVTRYRDLALEACVESAKKIIADGAKITMEEVYNSSKNGWVSENSIVRAMIKKGMATTYEDAKEKYFHSDSKYRIPVHKIPLEDAINLIKEAGGIPVLAHPFHSNFSKDDASMEAEIVRLKNLGIEGIEAIYKKNTAEQTYFLKSLAKKYNLFITAGSDYHAQPKKDELGMYLDDTEIIKYVY